MASQMTSPSSYKTPIVLLTCILRLRVQPTVKWATIAAILYKLMPNRMLFLETTTGTHPNDFDQDPVTRRKWSISYLKNMFLDAEEDIEGKDEYERAKEKGVSEIKEILNVCGIKGREVLDGEEMERQIRWRREGDWRAGSVQDGGEVRRQYPVLMKQAEGIEYVRGLSRMRGVYDRGAGENMAIAYLGTGQVLGPPKKTALPGDSQTFVPRIPGTEQLKSQSRTLRYDTTLPFRQIPFSGLFGVHRESNLLRRRPNAPAIEPIRLRHDSFELESNAVIPPTQPPPIEIPDEKQDAVEVSDWSGCQEAWINMGI